MASTHVVMDLQFGSTGKGALAHLLGEYLQPDVVATAWGPNAGHSHINAIGAKFVHTMLANSMLSQSVHVQLMGPGSVINFDNLIAECRAAQLLLEGKEIIVHPSACVLTAAHAEREKALVRVGSTMKGTAAAVMDKMWRDMSDSPLARHLPTAQLTRYLDELAKLGLALTISENAYNTAMDRAKTLLIEGCQGFSLGLHTHFWPHTTSRDVSPAQAFADCRVPYDRAHEAHVWGVARTFPIRVANRFDTQGFMVGTSGPGYDDQQELNWHTDLHREPELTTVTKLPRRIFNFSVQQIVDACRICGPEVIALTFADYCQERPKVGQYIDVALLGIITAIEDATHTPVRILTFGPSITDAVIVNDEGEVIWLNDRTFGEVIQEMNDGYGLE